MSAYVDGDSLQGRLADPTVRIIEASIDKTSYDASHIPGALWVDHFADLLRNGDDSSGLVLTPRQFASLMSRLGIEPGTTVVWYGDRHSSYAIRGFWTMDFYRHPGGSYVLDGGRERWLREGRPVTSEPSTVQRSVYSVPKQQSLANQASCDEVKAAINAPDRVILDVRSDDEYIGRTVRAARGGHIPGAVHLEWTDVMAGDNVLKPEAELRRMFESQGVTPDKEVIAHCQLGIRAAHTWFVLKHVLGYPDVKNYDGSWQEWGNREDLPVER